MNYFIYISLKRHLSTVLRPEGVVVGVIRELDLVKIEYRSRKRSLTESESEESERFHFFRFRLRLRRL